MPLPAPCALVHEECHFPLGIAVFSPFLRLRSGSIHYFVGFAAAFGLKKIHSYQYIDLNTWTVDPWCGEWKVIRTTKEDMDLKKIAESGQNFRVKMVGGEAYRFVYKSFALFISKKAPCIFNVSCSPKEWEEVWIPYFDLESSYKLNPEDFENLYLKKAINAGKGIRILRQDPWECLISFIISQRKNIPAIRLCVEKMSEERGEIIQTPQGIVKSFPNPEALLTDLSEFRLGYREEYVGKAAEKVATGKLDLVSLENFSDLDLKSELKKVKGVGEKVANCISLFGYHRLACAPVDVWIERTINEWFGGVNPFDKMEQKAGILQQCLYFYARSFNSGGFRIRMPK